MLTLIVRLFANGRMIEALCSLHGHVADIRFSDDSWDGNAVAQILYVLLKQGGLLLMKGAGYRRVDDSRYEAIKNMQVVGFAYAQEHSLRVHGQIECLLHWCISAAIPSSTIWDVEAVYSLDNNDLFFESINRTLQNACFEGGKVIQFLTSPNEEDWEYLIRKNEGFLIGTGISDLLLEFPQFQERWSRVHNDAVCASVKVDNLPDWLRDTPRDEELLSEETLAKLHRTPEDNDLNY